MKKRVLCSVIAIALSWCVRFSVWQLVTATAWRGWGHIYKASLTGGKEKQTPTCLSVWVYLCVTDWHTHGHTLCPSHLLPPLLAAHEQTHLAILDTACDKFVKFCPCLDCVVCGCMNFLVSSQTPEHTRIHTKSIAHLNINTLALQPSDTSAGTPLSSTHINTQTHPVFGLSDNIGLIFSSPTF